MQFDRNDHRAHIESYIDNMPSLSTTFGKVVNICSVADVSPNELYKVISLDPILTAQVLKLINQTYYSLADQITSLIRAMTMLGLNTVKNMTLSTAIMTKVPGANKLEELPTRNFWDHSISVGVTAKLLAREKDIPLMEREEYFIAGLLHDLGKLPFGNHYGRVLARSEQKNISRIEAERELLGTDHQQVGLMIAEKWKLNKVIADCIGYHHDLDRADPSSRFRIAIIAVGNAYTNLCDQEGHGDISSSEDSLRKSLAIAGLSWQQLTAIREDIESEIEKAKAFLQIESAEQILKRQSLLKMKFWGVRGSIPCPGPSTVKYGGNSSCLELRGGFGKKIIIIDAGTGIRDLGNALVKNDLSAGSLDIDLFLTHTHWDHIMGFPYFAPIYLPGTRLQVFGPVSYEEDALEDVVAGQMKYRYFPVNIGDVTSSIKYIRLKENPRIDLGNGLTLATKILNHPLLTLGYRFEFRGKIFCTCYDTEPFRNLFISDPEHPDYDEGMATEGEIVAEEQNRVLEQFFAGADLLVYDAQFTEKEYVTKVGWGHSTHEQAIKAALRAKVKRLGFIHHDPERTDEQIDKLARIYCEPGKYGDLDVFFAREGMEIDLFQETLG